MYLVEGWVKPIPPVFCIVVVVVVAGEGQNPENEHECSFQGCPVTAVVTGGGGSYSGSKNCPNVCISFKDLFIVL